MKRNESPSRDEPTEESNHTQNQNGEGKERRENAKDCDDGRGPQHPGDVVTVVNEMLTQIERRIGISTASPTPSHEDENNPHECPAEGSDQDIPGMVDTVLGELDAPQLKTDANASITTLTRDTLHDEDRPPPWEMREGGTNRDHRQVKIMHNALSHMWRRVLIVNNDGTREEHGGEDEASGSDSEVHGPSPEEPHGTDDNREASDPGKDDEGDGGDGDTRLTEVEHFVRRELTRTTGRRSAEPEEQEYKEQETTAEHWMQEANVMMVEIMNMVRKVNEKEIRGNDQEQRRDDGMMAVLHHLPPERIASLLFDLQIRRDLFHWHTEPYRFGRVTWLCLAHHIRPSSRYSRIHRSHVLPSRSAVPPDHPLNNHTNQKNNHDNNGTGTGSTSNSDTSADEEDGPGYLSEDEYRIYPSDGSVVQVAATASQRDRVSVRCLVHTPSRAVMGFSTGRSMDGTEVTPPVATVTLPGDMRVSVDENRGTVEVSGAMGAVTTKIGRLWIEERPSHHVQHDDGNSLPHLGRRRNQFPHHGQRREVPIPYWDEETGTLRTVYGYREHRRRYTDRGSVVRVIDDGRRVLERADGGVEVCGGRETGSSRRRMKVTMREGQVWIRGYAGMRRRCWRRLGKERIATHHDPASRTTVKVSEGLNVHVRYHRWSRPPDEGCPSSRRKDQEETLAVHRDGTEIWGCHGGMQDPDEVWIREGERERWRVRSRRRESVKVRIGAAGMLETRCGAPAQGDGRDGEVELSMPGSGEGGIRIRVFREKSRGGMGVQLEEGNITYEMMDGGREGLRWRDYKEGWEGTVGVGGKVTLTPVMQEEEEKGTPHNDDDGSDNDDGGSGGGEESDSKDHDQGVGVGSQSPEQELEQEGEESRREGSDGEENGSSEMNAERDYPSFDPSSGQVSLPDITDRREGWDASRGDDGMTDAVLVVRMKEENDDDDDNEGSSPDPFHGFEAYRVYLSRTGDHNNNNMIQEDNDTSTTVSSVVAAKFPGWTKDDQEPGCEFMRLQDSGDNIPRPDIPRVVDWRPTDVVSEDNVRNGSNDDGDDGRGLSKEKERGSHGRWLTERIETHVLTAKELEGVQRGIEHWERWRRSGEDYRRSMTRYDGSMDDTSKDDESAEAAADRIEKEIRFHLQGDLRDETRDQDNESEEEAEISNVSSVESIEDIRDDEGELEGEDMDTMRREDQERWNDNIDGGERDNYETIDYENKEEERKAEKEEEEELGEEGLDALNYWRSKEGREAEAAGLIESGERVMRYQKRRMPVAAVHTPLTTYNVHSRIHDPLRNQMNSNNENKNNEDDDDDDDDFEMWETMNDEYERGSTEPQSYTEENSSSGDDIINVKEDEMPTITSTSNYYSSFSNTNSELKNYNNNNNINLETKKSPNYMFDVYGRPRKKMPQIPALRKMEKIQNNNSQPNRNYLEREANEMRRIKTSSFAKTNLQPIEKAIDVPKIVACPPEIKFGTIVNNQKFKTHTTLTNVGQTPGRFNIRPINHNALSLNYPKGSVAPGMSVNVEIQILSEKTGKINSEMIVSSPAAVVKIPIIANIVDRKDFNGKLAESVKLISKKNL